MYSDFAVARSRLNILKTWLKLAQGTGLVHGECFVIGTPSMRARHSVIVNIPSAESAWGKEMRELFITEPDWALVGCDSKGNQARGLAHFLGDQTFIDTLINGDIHTFNANLLDNILKKMGISWDNYLLSIGIKADEKHTLEENLASRKRAAAKRILYAFLFGGSGAKLWSYIFGVLDKVKGNKLKKGFINAVPGFTVLLEKLDKVFGKTSQYGDGYIYSIVGTRIYVDSFHKLLVYLLQATEKATTSAAIMLLIKRLREANIPFRPKIYMHDEVQFTTPIEFAEKAAEIGRQAFADGPKLMGVQIMGGSSKIGKNWHETH